MAGKLMLVDDKDIETWWGNAAITTHTSLKTQHNNVIKNIKHVFMGKNTAVMYNWIEWNTKI